MAQQLVQAGVNLVQVNLENNEAWDTHDNNFPLLRDCLLPPEQLKGSGLFYLASVVVRLRTWHAQNEIVQQVKCSTF